ncbi:CoA transferase [Aeromicrobium sp. YIM 150415]|uniref:CaiB/BaiF CoA transferase family protein n=1 Tax=Aeromicrobium sp. YIM 150415 TaxID=2803912 RepID=UPI00196653A8|nr:CoA transferase [Aeromicrobium sp. YIM 150415]MBM9464139.1 CoA transferase [Aeromicrobium sp. YIM 150415]
MTRDAGTGSGPLAGVRVVDVTQYIAGPGATSVLADLGADVVKVEPLRGEATRHLGSFGQGMFHAYNRRKRSLAVDLSTARGRAVVAELIADADVVVQNLRPSAMAAMGLDAAGLRERNPRLIYVSISGFGAEGPGARRAGLDIAAQAESGIMSITGEAAGEPQRVGFAVVDVATAQAAAQAILAALYDRERGGTAADIELSLIETAVNIQAANVTEYFVTGRAPVRSGNGQPGAAPAADLIRTKDGFVVLSAYTPPHWARLCELIGRHDLVTDERLATVEARVAHRSLLHEVLDDAFSAMTTDECVERLTGNGLVAGAVRDYDGMVGDEVVERLGVVGRFDRAPTGTPGRYIRLPYRMSTLEPTLGGVPAPAVGEHTRSLLTELGYEPADIVTLVDEGVVADHPTAGTAGTRIANGGVV